MCIPNTHCAAKIKLPLLSTQRHRHSPDQLSWPCTLCSDPPAERGGKALPSSTCTARCLHILSWQAPSHKGASAPAADTCQPRTARQKRSQLLAEHKNISS